MSEFRIRFTLAQLFQYLESTDSILRYQTYGAYDNMILGKGEGNVQTRNCCGGQS